MSHTFSDGYADAVINNVYAYVKEHNLDITLDEIYDYVVQMDKDHRLYAYATPSHIVRWLIEARELEDW